MARKKSVVEPQEEQIQEASTPVEELADGGGDNASVPAEEVAEGWGGQDFGGVADGEGGPNDGTGQPDGEAPPAPAEFSPGEEPPFEGAPEAGDTWRDAAPIEQPDVGGEPMPEGGEDYGALLNEVNSATPIETEPLILGDEGEIAPGKGVEDVPPQIPDDEGMAGEAGETLRRVSDRTSAPRPGSRSVFSQRSGQVLTINAHERIETEAERQEIIWHEIRNAYRTRHIITGTLDGLEQTPSGRTLAVVDYKGFRVAIPLKEMLFLPKQLPSGTDYMVYMDRQRRNLANMLGAEIDFVVKGIDSNTHSIVASRKDAMLRKRQVFYMNTDELGAHMIYEGRVVQARVIAVAEKVVRVEAFGVECAIIARDLSWEWLGDAREHFNVGDRILIRVQTIDRANVEELSITADIRSVSSTTNVDNVKKCQVQCRYVGRVTDVRAGVVYIRLNNGVNAIAHACYDMRTPGKKDDVSFAVTRLDEEKGVAVGIITRIIKQNL